MKRDQKAFRLAVGCAAIVLALCCGPNAFAAPTVSLEPAFSAGAHLGEPTALTAELKIAGTEYGGFPEPLTELSLRLPASTVLSNAGFPTCSPQTLAQHGPSGCPAGSVAGPAGSFTVIVAFGTERISETGTTETFFTEDFGGFLLYLHGISPVSIEIISLGVIEPASAPFGPAVKFEVPLIQAVPGAPDASFTALTLGLGAFIRRAGTETGSVTAPETCPKGTLSWRADTTFNDQTGVHEMTAHAEAETACPAAGTRIGTTTQLTASNVSPAAGEPVTYTATVAAKTSSLSTPTGTVEFLDSGAPIAGCEAVTVVPAAPSSTATCHATPEIGAHTITAVYQGDSNFLRSEAAPVAVTVTAGSGEEAKRKAEEEAAKKHQEEQAAATKRHEEEAAAKNQGPGSGGGGQASVAGSIGPLSGGVTVPLHCSATSGSCAPVTVQLVVVEQLRNGQLIAVTAGHKSKPKTKKRTVVIGSSTVTLSAGQSETVKVSLNSAGKKLQAQHKRLTASLQITSAGQTLKSENVTITQTTHRGKKEHK